MAISTRHISKKKVNGHLKECPQESSSQSNFTIQHCSVIYYQQLWLQQMSLLDSEVKRHHFDSFFLVYAEPIELMPDGQLELSRPYDDDEV